jgi:uncharacterized protein (DUF1330 family)
MQVVPLSFCILALSVGIVHAQSKPDPAYLIAEIEVTDPASMKQFIEASNPIVKAHGGEFISRGGKVVTGFGTAPKGATIVRFESLEKAQAYYNSKEYKDIIPLRDKAMKYRGYLLEGGDHSR